MDADETITGGWWQPSEGTPVHEVMVQFVPGEEQPFSCKAQDLGMHGVFIHSTRTPPERGQLVEIELKSESVIFEAEVVHPTAEAGGFIVRFVNLDNRLRKVLRRLTD